MGWVIRLNQGNFDFDANTTRWSLRDRVEIAEDGSTDYLETVLAIEGEILPDAGTPQADVAENVTEKFKEMRDYLLSDTPVRIQLILDGTVEYDFQPGSQIGTPKCRDLSQIPTGADHATHVRFNAAFYMKSPKNGFSGGVSVSDFKREVTEESKDGQVVKKTWHAIAKGTSLAAAKAKVMSFKPKVKPLTQTVTERIDINEFEATWVWERGQQQNKVTIFRETYAWRPFGGGWLPDPLVGKDTVAFMHKRRNTPGEVRVRIEVEGSDRTEVGTRPPLHFSEDKSVFFRDETQEQNTLPPICIDRVKGIYFAAFEEFWYVNAGITPQPNHSGHDQPFPIQPAPNGAIGGSQGGSIAP